MKRTVAYQYDAVGNRTQVQDNGGLGSITTAYLANPLNQYTSVGGDSLSYDGNGNLTGVAAAVPAAGSWTYQYDAQNRLISAQSAILAVQFSYDARNRCVNRKFYTWTSGSWFLTSDSFLLYDGWNLIEERDATWNGVASYIHGAKVDELLAKITLDNTVYYHQDALGSVTHLTDATGSVVESYQYDVYGTPSFFDAAGNPATAGKPQPSSLVGNRFLFTGREWL